MPERSAETRRIRFEKTSDGIIAHGVVRGVHDVFTDERTHEPPVGSGNDEHPSPVDLFVASLAACQASVLAQTLDKARIDEFRIDVVADIGDKIDADIADEVPDKWFIEDIDVAVTLEVDSEYESRARRCLEVYDQGCIVGRSITRGVTYDPETELNLVRN